MIYNVNAKVKVYEKPYFRKNSKGKKEKVYSIQKSIIIPKDSIFTNGEAVVILKPEDFKTLNNPNEDVFKLKSYNDKLTNEVETLKKSIIEFQDNISSISSERDIATNEVETLRNSLNELNKDYKLLLEQENIKTNKISTLNSELKEIKGKQKNNTEILKFILALSDEAVKNAIHYTKEDTVNLSNDFLNNCNFWSRIKGINIPSPEIPEDNIKDRSMKNLYEKIENKINANNLLE